MIELPEVAKSYRREPVKRGFRAFVPAESAAAREARELREFYEREFNQTYTEQLKQYMLSNLVRQIGLHDVDSY